MSVIERAMQELQMPAAVRPITLSRSAPAALEVDETTALKIVEVLLIKNRG